MNNKHLFTSESVTEGHPDKVCDQISDAILDDIMAKDPAAHVACEVTATTGMVHVMGEISTECYVDIETRSELSSGMTVCDLGHSKDFLGQRRGPAQVPRGHHLQRRDVL